MLDRADRPTEPLVGQPIELPPNEDGLDLSLLPPMREAFLSTEEITSLFDDIGHFASDVQLMKMTRRGERAAASRADSEEALVRAREALLAGSVSRLQVRYRWQDALWIDTLSRREDGFLLIRIQHAQRDL